MTSLQVSRFASLIPRRLAVKKKSNVYISPYQVTLLTLQWVGIGIGCTAFTIRHPIRTIKAVVRLIKDTLLCRVCIFTRETFIT
jgi:hypothetical protein